jgi:hypothetical protein
MLDIFNVDSTGEQPPVDRTVRYALVSDLGGDDQWMHSILRLFYCQRCSLSSRGWTFYNQRRLGNTPFAIPTKWIANRRAVELGVL